MNDRDSLFELFEIVILNAKNKNLKRSLLALEHMNGYTGIASEVYLRRRLSVCRMLLNFHLPVEDDTLDSIITVSLYNSLPGDDVPESHKEHIKELIKDDSTAQNILLTLEQKNYRDMTYYENLVKDKYALIIRLTERCVLFETLYEWPFEDAKTFIRQTRESFFPMCIYARENYPEFAEAATILMEKTKNLLQANEVILSRYEETETNLDLEILSLTEENALIKRIIEEYRN